MLWRWPFSVCYDESAFQLHLPCLFFLTGHSPKPCHRRRCWWPAPPACPASPSAFSDGGLEGWQSSSQLQIQPGPTPRTQNTQRWTSPWLWRRPPWEGTAGHWCSGWSWSALWWCLEQDTHPWISSLWGEKGSQKNTIRKSKIES